MKLSTLKKILKILITSGLAILLIGCIFNSLIAILGLIIVIAWRIVAYFYCYCPVCKKGLPAFIFDLNEPHCPHCGEMIDYNQFVERHVPFSGPRDNDNSQ